MKHLETCQTPLDMRRALGLAQGEQAMSCGNNRQHVPMETQLLRTNVGTHPNKRLTLHILEVHILILAAGPNIAAESAFRQVDRVINFWQGW